MAELEPICIEIASPVISGPVLSRVTAFLAARAGLSVDRVSDALLVADTISAAHVFLQVEPLRVAIVAREGMLELLLGPLETGAAERIVGAPHIDGHGILDGLVDERLILPDSDGRERLRLVLGRTAVSPA